MVGPTWYASKFRPRKKGHSDKMHHQENVTLDDRLERQAVENWCICTRLHTRIQSVSLLDDHQGAKIIVFSRRRVCLPMDTHRQSSSSFTDSIDVVLWSQRPCGHGMRHIISRDQGSSVAGQTAGSVSIMVVENAAKALRKARA